MNTPLHACSNGDTNSNDTSATCQDAVLICSPSCVSRVLCDPSISMASLARGDLPSPDIACLDRNIKIALGRCAIRDEKSTSRSARPFPMAVSLASSRPVPPYIKPGLSNLDWSFIPPDDIVPQYLHVCTTARYLIARKPELKSQTGSTYDTRFYCSPSRCGWLGRLLRTERKASQATRSRTSPPCL